MNTLSIGIIVAGVALILPVAKAQDVDETVSAESKTPWYRSIAFRPAYVEVEDEGGTFGFSLDFSEFVQQGLIGLGDSFRTDVKLNYAVEEAAEVDPTLVNLIYDFNNFGTIVSIDLFARVAYEADNHFNNQTTLFGGWSGATWQVDPYSVLTANIGYDGAYSISSTSREAVGVSEHVESGRASAQVHLDRTFENWGIGNDSITVDLEGHYYHEHKWNSDLLPNEKGGYGFFRTRITYDIRPAVFKRMMRGIFFQYQTGRLPTSDQNQDLFLVGVDIIGE